MKLSQRELEVISNALISCMGKMSESKKYFVDFPDTLEKINDSVSEIQKLNSKICSEMKG